MSEPTPVCQLTEPAFRALTAIAQQRPELWQDPNTDFAAVLVEQGITEYQEPIGIATDPPFNFTMPAGDGQALDFHRALAGLTPAQAANPRLLAWLNHFRLHAYGIERWPLRKNSAPARHVRRHWLSTRNSDVYSSNIAGRLWWLADTALKAAAAAGGAFTAEQALQQFAARPEQYHYCMRFAFMRQPLLTAEYVRVLLNEAKGINQAGVIDLVRRLERLSGALLLDNLNREQLRALLLSAADQAMSSDRHVSHRRYLKNRQPLVALSLGAGVQSSVLALMAEQGYEGMTQPDLAIFADTGWEPPSVYAHLDWLETQLSYPVVRVNNGSIKDDLRQGRNPRGGAFLNIPAYLTMPSGQAAIAKRQCTADYKLTPIRRELRRRLGLEPGQRAPKELQVEMWLGISADEAGRQKPSRDEWITNRWPLVERDYSRAQLYQWFMDRYPERTLPRSACVGCPYRSNSEWKQLKERHPAAFAEAAAIDRDLRELPVLRKLSPGAAFLHRSRQPLDEVDLSRAPDADAAMQQECEGLCGI